MQIAGPFRPRKGNQSRDTNSLNCLNHGWKDFGISGLRIQWQDSKIMGSGVLLENPVVEIIFVRNNRDMHPDCYKYSTNETFLDFEFESDGPRGKIKKIVRFSPQNATGITYFNLGLGDLNEQTGKIDDLSISNNKDRDKILFTVAATVRNFMEHFPDAIVYAKGSTPARTRLYQMGIRANLEQIESFLEIYGYANGSWSKFADNNININYEAFLAFRKK